MHFDVWNYRRFLFGMSPDVPRVRVSVFTSDFNFELEYMDISDRHSHQILFTYLTFIALQILRKVLICCARLLFGVCYYVDVQFTPVRVIDISHYIMVSKI